jgi:hypothetical protein
MKRYLKDKSWIELGFILAWLIIVALFLFGLTGCLTEKNLPKHNDKFPSAAAEYAHKKFPLKDSAGRIDTTYIKADNKDYSSLIDSINNVIDSINTDWTNAIDSSTTAVSEALLKKIIDGKKEIEGLKGVIARLRNEYRPCKPDTIKLASNNYWIDGSAITMYEQEKQKVATVTGELQKTKDKLNWWKTACIITWSIIGIVLAFKIGFSLKKP